MTPTAKLLRAFRNDPRLFDGSTTTQKRLSNVIDYLKIRKERSNIREPNHMYYMI